MPDLTPKTNVAADAEVKAVVATDDVKVQAEADVEAKAETEVKASEAPKPAPKKPKRKKPERKNLDQRLEALEKAVFGPKK